MADWRTSKCVPDSDDEDEYESTYSLNEDHRASAPPAVQDLNEQANKTGREEGGHGKISELGRLQPKASQARAVEVRITTARSSQIKALSAEKTHSESSAILPNDSGDDIDELQADHEPRHRASSTNNAVTKPTGSEYHGASVSSGLLPTTVTAQEAQTFGLANDVSQTDPSNIEEGPATHLDHKSLGSPPAVGSLNPDGTLSLPEADATDTDSLSSIDTLPDPSAIDVLREVPATSGKSAHGDHNDNSSSVAALLSPSMTVPPARSLRQRKAIQMRPYMVESERYRRFFHDRGIKALRITQAESQRLVMDASQGQESHSSNASSSSSPRNLTPEPPSPIDLQSSVEYGDEDFPDMQQLLERQDVQLLPTGNKRRRLSKNNIKHRSMLANLRAGRQTSLTNRSHSPSTPKADAVYDVPPSPPSSQNGEPQDNSSVLRRKRHRSSPKSLPTPATSSEPRDPLRRTSIGSAMTRPQNLRSSDVSDESSSPEASDRDTAPVEDPLGRARNKIRGVLPASWLRLDLHAQTSVPQAQHQRSKNTSTAKRDSHKGVARLLTGSKTRSTDPAPHLLQQDIFVESDNESLSSRNARSRKLEGREPPIIEINDDSEPESTNKPRREAAEDNEIDAMLPARSRHVRGKTRKRQRMVSEYALQGLGVHQRRKQRDTPQSWLHCSHASTKPGKPKKRPPTLSILDATAGTSANNSVKIPSFVRVANRTAKQRSNLGRHSPTRKFVRLATQQDTHDANQELKAWRAGDLPKKFVPENASSIKRRPFAPTSANIRRSNASSHNHLPRPDRPSRNVYRSSTLSGTEHAGQGGHGGKSSLLDNQLQANPVIAPEASSNALPLPQRRNRKEGRLLSSVRDSRSSWPAALEVEGQEKELDTLARHLLPDFSDVRGTQAPNPIWNRFFDATEFRSPSSTIRRTDSDAERPTKGTQKHRSSHGQRRRKRHPRQIDLSMTWQDTLDHEHPLEDQVIELPGVKNGTELHGVQTEKRQFKGLGPFGTRFSSTFEVVPFPRGTCFGQHTFLGSGRFARSVQLCRTDLDASRGFSCFVHHDQTYHWGPWNESVSTDLSDLSDWLLDATSDASRAGLFPRSACLLLGSLVDYSSCHLYFLDPIDRVAFIQHCCSFVQRLNLAWSTRTGVMSDKEDDPDIILEAKTLTLVFINQVKLVADHELVQGKLKLEVAEVLKHQLVQVVHLFWGTFGQVERLVASVNSPSYLDMTIEHNAPIEAFVVVHQICKRDPTLTMQFATLVLDPAINMIPRNSIDATLFEQMWKQMFHLLPCLEFDDQGIHEAGHRFSDPSDGWPQVRRLLRPVLESYISNQHGQGPNFNSYFRALLGRCLHLVNFWGWIKCDGIVGYLFDFFAKNHLHLLLHEESRGSPVFLEQLRDDLRIGPEPADRTFHLFLKIVGSGIRSMRRSCSEKSIKGLVWRLMPNHGRSHPKEEAIRQEDLDALRSHHDLLCTLYWASPPDLRPKLTSLRDLVHIESSHREACQINIRAWSNLLNYQLSTNESNERLGPFIEWFEDFLHQLTRQHGLARTEAEEQLHLLRDAHELSVSNAALESTVSNNQRQIEAMLCEVLVSLHQALRTARTREQAETLLTPTISTIFSIFDASRRQTNAPIMETMDILLTYVRKDWTPTDGPVHKEVNDESQDYGDFPMIEAEDLAYMDTPSQSQAIFQVHDPLYHLLSNCFGADTAPSDDVLQRVIDCWIGVARSLVKAGSKSWSDYIGSYGANTWHALRDTAQKQKYTPYYFSVLADTETSIYVNEKEFFLRFWIESLVERESLLKYQGNLTAAILNADLNNPLLSNLPFSRNGSNRKYEISPRDFCERRLSLISSVLSNMRNVLDNEKGQDITTALQRKQDYKALLRQLMNAMKSNYVQLGQGTVVKGAYVEFVHKVVEFLQQYTSSVCSVDRFFTDNVSFPLPAHDPTYVVGQLKNFGLRLSEPRAPKELATFLQSVSERAAVDNQQGYLADQLYAAIAPTFEEGSNQPTLRSFITKALFPSYACMALNSACGWILAHPFLQAFRQHFAELLSQMDVYNRSSSQSMSSIITTFLEAAQCSLLDLGHRPQLMSLPSTLKTIRGFYAIATALLPTLDYLVRAEAPANTAKEVIDELQSLAAPIRHSLLTGDQLDPLPFERTSSRALANEYEEIHTYASKELRESLDRNWLCIDGNYFITRGSIRREVLVDVGLYEEEKAELLEAFEAFEQAIVDMPAFTHDERPSTRKIDVTQGLEELVL